MRGIIARRFSVGVAIVGSLLIGLLVAFSDVNQAKAWPFTSGEHIGFFTGTPDSFGSFVIAEGLSATTGAGLITQVRNALYNTGGFSAPQDDIGAAFIVLTMLGCVENGCGVTGAASGISTAKSRFAEWSSIVTQYANAGLISNVNFTYVRNTYSQNVAPHDVAWYTPAGGAQTDPAIVFRSPTTGAVIYAIKHECGNPVGNVNKLPALAWSLTGSTAVSSATATPGQTVTFTHTIRNTGDATATGWTWRAFLMPPTPGIGSETPVTAPASGGSLAAGASRNFTNPLTIPGNANPGDRYCERVGYDPVNNNSPPTRNGRGNTICVTVTGWSLSATSTVTPNAVRPGAVVQFRHTVRNNGNMTTGAWSWQYFWSDPAGNVSGSVGGACPPSSGSGPSLGAGASTTLSCNYTVPAGSIDGQQYCMLIQYTPANNQVPPLTNQRSAPACVQVHLQIVVLCNVTAPLSSEESTSVPITVTITQTAATSFFPVAAPLSLNYTVTATNGYSSTHSASAMSDSFTIPNAQAGQYTVTATFRGGPAGGLDSVNPAVSFNPCGTFSVYRAPYFRVYGGDAQAGAAFSPTCGAIPSAQIQAFNKGSAGGYAGAGTQIAAIASGAIDQFVSADLRGANPRVPAGLTFSNTSGASPYFGNYASGPCIPDYWGLAAYGPNQPAGYNLGATSVNAPRDIFVDGDVQVSGDVTYANDGSWSVASVTGMPYFRLIVRGNIYIQSGVHSLSGLYVALPRPGGGGGMIYTCASGLSAPSQATVVSGCTSKLTVYGSFVAKEVKLLRNVGTRAAATVNEPATSANIGEVFIFSPESWIAHPQTTLPGLQSYDAITSLPPVL